MLNFKLGFHRHGETNELYHTLNIDKPYEALTILSSIDNIEDLDYFIEWLEELIERRVSDYSEDGFIIFQPILWGSRKSKIAEIDSNNKLIGNQEFDTKEFLDVCYAWRDFLGKKTPDNVSNTN